ncbi:MAG: GNAT family N-acetyltransferase [Nanoarchaeota archaeon]|nr:GNAT family N-acetyltransferase [Nanoarchaeota archaeon]
MKTELVKIRKAKNSDIDACLKLQKLDNDKYWKIEDFRSSAKNNLVIFLVAERESKIVGYIIGFVCPTKKSDVMLHETRVSKKCRGEGIGSALVDNFVKESFRRNAKDVYALIEPELTNFYVRSCGFKKSQNWMEVKKTK